MSKKAKGSLPYDRTDRESVYYYAIDLRGSTRREKTDADAIDDIRRNKGSFGSAVESCYFMLDANNKSEADFPEAGLELKTTPLKRNKDGSLSAKERLGDAGASQEGGLQALRGRARGRFGRRLGIMLQL